MSSSDTCCDSTRWKGAAPIFDYYVRCAAESNLVSVSIAASAGWDALLLAPVKSTPKRTQKVPVSLAADGAIVAAATDGTTTVEYWVRCLPPDFPVFEWSAHPEAGTPTAGYYLVGTMFVPTSVGGYAIVFDARGVPVWYAHHSGQVYDVESVVDGGISFAAPFVIEHLAPLKTTDIRAFGASPDIHELRALPNGDFVVFWQRAQTGVDLTGLTIPLADGGSVAFGASETILSCDILEVDAAGKVVWEWVATDHFDPAVDMTYRAPSLARSPVDVFHCNSIDVDPANGNLLVSARNMDSVFYVERATGRVVWKMGGAAFTKDRAAYVAPSSPFYRQHDARLGPGWKSTCTGGSGRLSVFDDETDRPGPARGVVYDVTIGPSDGGGASDCGGAAVDAAVPGDAAAGADGGVAAVLWQYQGLATTSVTGSFRVLPDGSHTIGWGSARSPMTGLILSDVDPWGNDLLDVINRQGVASYRSVKVPLTALDIRAMRAACCH